MDKLRRDHSVALESAAFMAMTPEDATAHEERGRRIKFLVQQLAALITEQ